MNTHSRFAAFVRTTTITATIAAGGLAGCAGVLPEAPSTSHVAVHHETARADRATSSSVVTGQAVAEAHVTDRAATSSLRASLAHERDAHDAPHGSKHRR